MSRTRSFSHGRTEFTHQHSSNRAFVAAISGLAMLASMASCQQSSQPRGGKLEKLDVTPATTPGTPLTRLKKGMAYADFRTIALEDGWRPVVDLECRANVIGGNYSELCSAHPGLDDCRVCEDLPELGSCSGDGYCGMSFKRNTSRLDVTTYGMIEDRFVKGEGSRLQVMGWEGQASER